MTYKDTIAYLYASQPPFHLVGAAAYKPGLANTEALMEHLRHPERRFRAIHIAGTNGKGSTSHLIAASLHAAGLKVGLYTSPHLVDFRERIRVSEDAGKPMKMIEEERVVRFVEENRDFLEKVKPSFFETTMAMAFTYFATEQVDVAVIETGLGGRLDSTNILPPYAQGEQPPCGVTLSVITNIGLDHTEFLGNTLPQIAYEKAGIIKPDVPCVIGETDEQTMPVFMEAAERNHISGGGPETDGCRIWFADQCEYLRRERQRTAPDCQLKGEYQEKNIQTAFAALRAVWNTLTENRPTAPFHEAVRKGFAEVCTLTGLRGRWEVLRSRPLTVCDTGHNSHGLRYVSHQLQQTMRERLLPHADSVLRVVFGMVDDKDVETVAALMPRQAVYYLTRPDTHRAIPAERMLAIWKKAMPDTKASTYDHLRDALTAAQKDCSDNDVLFIGGSNYIVGEALTLLAQ
ncbi:MAG: bifunctional folylpolyglutamate synthase/dihydrofolate synthase [Paludibacteraceae bacterium]|nr:bifunctional folylpolyglutamate synthase/dihydrofolate synthase [Paludibacteraceae bacterium]